MPRLQSKNFATPDAVNTMPKVRFETVGLDDVTVGHCTFEPGWRWSTDMGPMIGTPSCQMRHLGYTISGALHVVMDDGGRSTSGRTPSSRSRRVTTNGCWAMSPGEPRLEWQRSRATCRAW